MRLPLALVQAAAALVMALLLLACPAQARSISNTAFASWSSHGATARATSNTVSFDVAPSAISLDTLRPLPGASTIPVRAALCAGNPLLAIPGSDKGVVAVPAIAADKIRLGETLILRFTATGANRNPARPDVVVAILTTPAGDREVLTLLETANDSGIFSGAIQTRAVASNPIAGDCTLSTASGETIRVVVGLDETAPTLVTTVVAVLADPYGFVFDSDDGSPVSGARVTLVNAATGRAATVFAEDGITAWPSTVVSGEPIRDASGVTYVTAPGEYRFPLAPLGSYRLKIEPPAPYIAPSTRTPDELAGLSRPTGGDYMITDASYGEPLDLTSSLPVRVDIPLDRPAVAVSVTKSASRLRAQPGDAIAYTVTLRNPDQTRSKTGIALVDVPAATLRLRSESIRVDGATPALGTVVVSDEGRRLAIAVPAVAPGASVRVTYVMTVSNDAAPGQAVNVVTAVDPNGTTAKAQASVRIDRDTIAGRMTIIGRVTFGPCTARSDRPGIPGVRLMLEDGSFAVTDADGRYHFEGVVPGTHVVQAQRQTLPAPGAFVDCDRSTRSAGSPSSRFAVGQGGSLVVADFAADLTGWSPPNAEDTSRDWSELKGDSDNLLEVVDEREAAGGTRDWLSMGNGPPSFLFPEVDHNPRSPSLRVVIRHATTQTVELLANGRAVSALTLDGTSVSTDGTFAVTIWRGIPLGPESTHLSALIRNPDKSVEITLTRDVAFVSSPWNASIVRDRSKLVADGKTRPVVAVRLTDRQGRPVRSGVSGSVRINAPYESAAMIEQLQLQQPSGSGSASPNWKIEGDDGVALIELAPTMVSGPLHLAFSFADRDLTRTRELDGWIVPGDLDWTVIGLAEGSAGARSVADAMERAGNFDSDLGKDARIALYAKGRVLGRFLATLAYDSAKQKTDQRLLGTIDPDAYYTVYSDRSGRRYDAASREKLYLRVETATFYALYGDLVTGFDQTILGRYQRTMTGAKAEGRFGSVHAQGFVAKVGTRYRHDEIQGNGLSGPYRLSARAIVASSERVAIEVRDRLRAEIVIQRRELIRFIDYDIDLLSGTITFKEPVLSRDFDLNPQIIVIDYEVDEGHGSAQWNAGARADLSFGGDTLRLGLTGISDKGDASRVNQASIDLRARIGAATEIRTEAGVSRTDGAVASAWLVEAEHRSGSMDILAYVRSVDADFGTGQLSGAETGRRKMGLDARYAIDERLSLTGSAWLDESLVDDSRRRAAQLFASWRTTATEARLGIIHFSDQQPDGETARSTLVEGAVSQRLLGNRLELGASSSVALAKDESIDLPTRHRLTARYAAADWLRVVGNYEIARGDSIDARTINGGLEISPWQGGRATTTLGRQEIGELGTRSYAAFGLAQTVPLTEHLSLDATFDGNHAIGGASTDVINSAHPVASGGHLTGDGTLFEDFTAATLGLSWRLDRWSATARAEWRDGVYANRRGLTGGVIRQLGQGVVLGAGGTWTRAEGPGGVASQVADAAISAAYRPDEASFSALAKLEFRSDAVIGAVAGEAGPAGRTALAVSGDAKSSRLIASLSTNWQPFGNDSGELVRRTELGLFVGARHNFDRFEDYDLASTTLLGGFDLRLGIGDQIEIGGSATLRTSIGDGATSFAVGPQVGISPTKDALVTLGYNVRGFRDPDFTSARDTDKGLYAAVRLKFDADSFAFLGLGRR